MASIQPTVQAQTLTLNTTAAPKATDKKEAQTTAPSSQMEEDMVKVQAKTGLAQSVKGFVAGGAPSAVIGASIGAGMFKLMGGPVKLGAAFGAITGTLTGGVAGAMSANMTPEEVQEKSKSIMNWSLGTGAVTSFVLGMTIALPTAPIGMAMGQAVAETVQAE